MNLGRWKKESYKHTTLPISSYNTETKHHLFWIEEANRYKTHYNLRVFRKTKDVRKFFCLVETGTLEEAKRLASVFADIDLENQAKSKTSGSRAKNNKTRRKQA